MFSPAVGAGLSGLVSGAVASLVGASIGSLLALSCAVPAGSIVVPCVGGNVVSVVLVCVGAALRT
eukprot:11836634-Prorocentrum_lima.AAC.1